MKIRQSTVVTLLIGAALSGAAYANEKTPAEPPREKVGLVLSGGGARGLAHLGVIKALEEQHVPIDYIAGTSAGALIGGMYASGMSVEEISERIKDMDLGAIAFATADRREIQQNVRNLDYQANSIVDVSIKTSGEVTLPISVSNGAAVDAVLRDLLKNQPFETDFEKLPIPFNAVAADLATGKMVVLKKGQLAQSLRASMSIPAVFSPVEIDGQLLVDGMIDRNLPIDVVRQMGADRVIAIDVGTDLLKKNELNSVVAVSQQMLGLLVKRNVDEQIASLKPRDMLIRPQLDGIGNLAFEQSKKATELGYAELQKSDVKAQLHNFSLSPNAYKLIASKHRLPAPKNTMIDYVRVETNGLASPASLQSQVLMQNGELFNIETVNQDIKRIMSAGRISNVTYSVDKVGDKNELVYRVTEKDEARNSVRAGIEVTSNTISDQQFGLHLSHRNVWLNRLGGEWRNHLVLGKRTQLETQINQPLNYKGTAFIRPFANIGYEDMPAYLNNSSKKAAEYTLSRYRFGFLAGAPIGRLGEWGVGLSQQRIKVKDNTYNPSLIIQNDSQTVSTLDAELTLDQLDSVFVPTQGYFLKAYARVGLNKRYFSAGIQGQYAISHKQHSVTFAADVGGQKSREDDNIYLSPYSLGGYHRLSGYANNQLIGNFTAYGSATYRYRTALSILNNPLIVGTSLEVGNAWQYASDINTANLKYSASLFGALNTPIGPAQLGVGFNRNGKVNFYFFLGRTFSDSKW